MERALVAAGIDPQAAAEMKRQRDEISLAEIGLRDQATRDGWVDTPRFRDEMANLRHEQTSIRDEIGDDAYDRYLAALGQPNRVTVSEVLMESPAAQAGLQPGDVLLRYGETRLFAPEELVAQTHSGMPGEPVPLEVLRQGQRIEIEVRRGPLGLGVAPGHGNPSEG